MKKGGDEEKESRQYVQYRYHRLHADHAPKALDYLSLSNIVGWLKA